MERFNIQDEIEIRNSFRELYDLVTSLKLKNVDIHTFGHSKNIKNFFDSEFPDAYFLEFKIKRIAHLVSCELDEFITGEGFKILCTKEVPLEETIRYLIKK